MELGKIEERIMTGSLRRTTHTPADISGRRDSWPSAGRAMDSAQTGTKPGGRMMYRAGKSHMPSGTGTACRTGSSRLLNGCGKCR